MDDLIIGGTKLEEVEIVNGKLANEFDVVDAGPLNYYLVMEISREGTTGAITLCQKNYIKNLLMDQGMSDCKVVSTPLSAGFQVSCNDNKDRRVSQSEYQSLIGVLMHLAISTRPDILHSISILSQRNTDPHCEHEAAAKHVLRYLKGIRDMKIL